MAPVTPPAGEDVRRFMARMRHDLRTPINGIIGYSELLMEEATDDGRSDLAAALGAVRLQGKELLAQVNALMADTRLQAMAEIDTRAIGAELKHALAQPL